jgi:hypothetical protein
VWIGVLLAGCSSGDYGTAAGAPQEPAAQPVVVAPAAPTTVGRSDLPPLGARAGAAPSAAHTGADGYPNINVDTASRTNVPVRSAEERDRLEAELMALGERQRSSRGGTPQSVVEELQELGRRSKTDTLQQIESGAAPTTP